MTKRVSAMLGLIASLFPVVTSAQCFEAAGARYQVHPDLLRSIAFVESSWNNKATNQNSSGSEDVCMMQINSFWLKSLSTYGITRERLLDDACLCVETGAYILSSEIAASSNSWIAVGRYHTGPKGSEERKLAYANKVKRVFDHLQRSGD